MNLINKNNYFPLLFCGEAIYPPYSKDERDLMTLLYQNGYRIVQWKQNYFKAIITIERNRFYLSFSFPYNKITNIDHFFQEINNDFRNQKEKKYE